MSATAGKAAALRDLLAQDRLVILGGAHDALSAKLAERAGFDALWASGLGISAVHGVPDASILSMGELLQAAVVINDGSRLPVVADCDSGFGNVHNVQRMVTKYERAGIAGVCMEDQTFPKRNSLDADADQVLVPIDEFCAKIFAAKQAQASADFVVIARVEALIAGLGQENAYARASAYAESGADAILIHSRQRDPDEIAEFANRWNHAVPLVVVPTNYPTVTMDELQALGIRVAIYANQALRAATRAMDAALRAIVEHRTSATIEPELATVKEVFELQGTPEMDAEERVITEWQARIRTPADRVGDLAPPV